MFIRSVAPMDELGKISGISQASRSEIRNVLVKISASPSSADFWLLSRLFAVAEPDDLESVKSWALELLTTNKSQYLGANFALARLHRHLSEPLKESLYLPTNPGFAVDLLAAGDTDDQRITELLEYPNSHVQKVAASLIARHHSKDAIESLLKGASAKTDVQKCGMVQLLNQCLDEERPVRFYVGLLGPILLSEDFPAAAHEAQHLLAVLMRENQAAFHGLDCLKFVEHQLARGALVPEFLDACLRCYGLFAVRRIESGVIPKLLATENVELIKPVVCYLGYTSVQTQFQVQQALVEMCQRRPLDGDLHELAANAILSSAPAVSPVTGKFMEVVRRSPRSRAIANLLRNLLEPAGTAPLHKLSAVVVVADEDKRSIESQVAPDYACTEVQVGGDEQ